MNHDRFVYDALVCTSNLVCQYVDRLPNLFEVVELLVPHFLESSPWLRSRIVQMHQSQLSWTPCHHTVASRKKVLPNDRLQYGGFASALRA